MNILRRLNPRGEFADPYGSRPRDPFWFAGQGGAESGYNDQGLTWGGYPGFILMTHRWYNPALGRFWTSDPIGYEGGLNTYAYCRNNPINHIDPSGLEEMGLIQTVEKNVEELLGIGAKEEAAPVLEEAGTQVAVSVAARTTTVTTGLRLLTNFSLPVKLFSLVPVAYQAGQWLGNHFYGPETCVTSMYDPVAQQLYSKNRLLSLRRSTPAEPFHRMNHYGRTPTKPQQRAAGPGMVLDYDPPLVQHDYEGDGAGGMPGYKMTQAERLRYGRSLEVGNRVPNATRFSQGGTTAAYSMRKRFEHFGF